MALPYQQRFQGVGAFTLFVAIIAATMVACVSAPQVSQEDVREREEALLLEAIGVALEHEGYQVSAEAREGRYVETRWVGDQEHRRRVTVRVSHTSMGLALATRVQLAVPVAETGVGGVGTLAETRQGNVATSSLGEGGQAVLIDGGLWQIEATRSEAAKAEEGRVGKAIEAEWRSLRRAAKSAP